MKKLTFIDPKSVIWGLHIHQEIAKDQFPQALVVQQACKNFLSSQGINITAEDAIEPGYGPHLEYMWELRIEDEPARALEILGLSLSFMAVNHFDLNAYIHPLMHDATKEDDLRAEGLLNQGNAIWFRKKVPQNQNFFFDPPRDDNNNIIDTRTPRVISHENKIRLRNQGETHFQNKVFLNPFEEIINGFHIHVDYPEKDFSTGIQVFAGFVDYLINIGLPPTSTRHYEPRENGPHVLGGWEVKFETPDPSVIRNIGIAIAWLMCNRKHLPIFIHPVSWKEGDWKKEIYAHDSQSMFIDNLVPLDLTFFEK